MKKLTKIRESARGEDCEIRIPGICNFDPATTVLCHLNGAGIGMKALDIHAAYGCSACHDAVDHRKIINPEKDIYYNRDQLILMHMEGIIRTQCILIDKGLLVIK